MIIQQKRIRNPQRHLNVIPDDAPVVLGIPKDVANRARLIQIGFPNGGQINDSILPAGTFGPISRYNAQGKIVRHRDRPKIDVVRSVYSTWTDWHGDSHSGYVDRTYHCYPTTQLPAPGIELHIRATTAGEELLVCDPINYRAALSERICHVINLYLELFGECHLFTEDLDRIIDAPVRRLNWRILPQGELRYEQIRQEIDPLLNRRPPDQRREIGRRMETINGYQPNFVAVGQGGFTHYLVFGFPNRNIFLLESTFIDNATYVLGNNWERLSRMTKGELLDNNLVQQRIFHNESWYNRLATLFR